MAGLLEKIAKRLLKSIEPEKTPSSTPRSTAPKTAQSQTVRVKPIAPIVGPEKKVSSNWENISITLEKDMTTESMNTENMITEDKDDYLLSQIDEFRAKAQQLQDLLLTKESKVMELQGLVDEREGKAKELESILDERQKKADGITEEVSKQIENLIDKVTTKMEQIGVSLGRDLQEGQSLSSRQLEDLQSTLGTLTGQQMEDLKEAIGSMSEQQALEVKNALDSLNSQLEVVKTELSEKVHSENVKCYRNVSDLMKNLDDKLEAVTRAENNIEKKAKTIQGCTIAVLVFTIINMLGIAALVLLQLGIFQF